VIVQNQTNVIDFLSRPETHNLEGSGVERIDTHISIIFLVDERVFKLKRAVKFPYLDFSTIEKRKQACEAEVRINRRTAPDIYLGTRAVTKKPDGSLSLTDRGEVLDWLVEMKRFDQAGLFDRLAQKNALDTRQMDDLAAVIAHFHKAAETCFQGGGRKLIETVIDNNDSCFVEFGENIFDSKEIHQGAVPDN
jgi:uncharacterized protein